MPLRNLNANKRRFMGGAAFRMFVVLTLALLPLALIAFLSTLDSHRAANRQARQLLTAATEQSAGKLESDIMAVQTAQGLTVQSVASHMPVGDICGRMQIFVKGGRDIDGVYFLAIDRSGKILCAPTAKSPIRTTDILSLRAQSDVVLAPEAGGILIRSSSSDGKVLAATLYREDFLRNIVRPLASDGGRNFKLQQDGRTLSLGDYPVTSLGQIFEATAPIGDTGISLTTALPDKTETTSQILALLAPMAMWLAAVLMGWIVVRWLLIQPLVALRQAIGNYEPGRKLVAPKTSFYSSPEIAELGTAFEIMSEQVISHGDEMRRALDSQTKLTREVHHRVKNNLQIISSLINLHARASGDTQAKAAYLSIQRRVDALAVVQRNHYAELEESKGVSAPQLITEIASSLKASMPAGAERFVIQVDCDPVCLHQDVAAPVAFLVAELADEAISRADTASMRITLIADSSAPGHASLVIASDAFLTSSRIRENASPLVERVLTGLSRQLRAPLEYDGMAGEYRISLKVV